MQYCLPVPNVIFVFRLLYGFSVQSISLIWQFVLRALTIKLQGPPFRFVSEKDKNINFLKLWAIFFYKSPSDVRLIMKYGASSIFKYGF